MNKADIVGAILQEKLANGPVEQSVESFASSNIALCKYWGKRNQELNLPVTGSLSISLGTHGTKTELNIGRNGKDVVVHNGELFDLDSPFCRRLLLFLDLFRAVNKWNMTINIHTNIPLAAGLASSASGFASLVKALDALFHWELKEPELSILSRLGSGSACRSIRQGFVEWHAGQRADGMDSYGEVIPQAWPELCVGLLILSRQEKGLSSREAMQRTVMTSPFYPLWPIKVENDLKDIKQAIQTKDFHLLGKSAESNALAMHATMLSSWPPINYAIPETVLAIKKIEKLREEGLSLYFTQDAGPNIKLLFLENDSEAVRINFPGVELINCFR